MKATVKVNATIEVEVSGTWDDRCTLNQIRKDAASKATDNMLLISTANDVKFSFVNVESITLKD